MEENLDFITKEIEIDAECDEMIENIAKETNRTYDEVFNEIIQRAIDKLQK